MEDIKINLIKFRQMVIIFLLVSFLIALGPNLQHYFFSIVYSSYSSIYDSAFEGQLIHFPSLLDWIKVVGTLPVLIVSSFVFLAILNVKSPIGNAKRSGWACFISWCLVDLYAGISNGQDFNFYLTCFVANLLGGLIFSFLILVLFEIVSVYTDNARGNYQIDLFLGELISLFLVFVSFCFIYYVATFFFKPLPVDIRITSNYPVSGFLMTDKSKTTEVKDFLLPNRMTPSKVSLSSIHQDFNFNIAADSYSYNLKIAFLKDCVDYEQALENILPSSWNDYGSVNNFNLNVSEGVTEFSSSLNNRSFISNLENDFLSQYWLDLNESQESLEITQYLNNVGLDYETYPDSQYFFIHAYLVNKKDNAIISNPRRLRLTLDKEDYFYNFEAIEDFNYESNMSCRPIEFNIDDEDFDQINSLVSGVLISISPNNEDGIVQYYEKTKFSIRGGGGFRYIKNLGLNELKYNNEDKVEFLSIGDNIESVVINSIERNASSSDVYTAMGDLSIKYNNNGSVFIEGVADFLWNRQQRLNQTRWELSGMGWGEIITLLSAFLFSMYYVARKFILPKLLKNNDYVWKLF